MLKFALVALLLSVSPTLAQSYVVCDNGLRCFIAPCPSYNALNVDTGEVGRITSVDLNALSRHDRDALAQDIGSGGQVFHGKVSEKKSGTSRAPEIVLVVSNVERASADSERKLCQSER